MCSGLPLYQIGVTTGLWPIPALATVTTIWNDLPLLRFGSRRWDSKGGSLARLGLRELT